MSTVIRPKRRCTCEATGGEQDMSVDSTSCPVHGRRCPTCRSDDPAKRLKVRDPSFAETDPEFGWDRCSDPFHGLSGAAGKEDAQEASIPGGPAEAECNCGHEGLSRAFHLSGCPLRSHGLSGAAENRPADLDGPVAREASSGPAESDQGEGLELPDKEWDGCWRVIPDTGQAVSDQGECPNCGEGPRKGHNAEVPCDQGEGERWDGGDKSRIEALEARVEAAKREAEENAQASHENFWHAEVAQRGLDKMRERWSYQTKRAEDAEREWRNTEEALASTEHELEAAEATLARVREWNERWLGERTGLNQIWEELDNIILNREGER